MGTRCLTFVYDDNSSTLVNLYRQFDGYPDGHGLELAEFLNSFVAITNGIAVGEKRKTANGMGCLAAQMIAHFKTGCGGFYLHATDETDCWQDYEYHVYEHKVIVKSPRDVIFNGTWQDFLHFCKNPVTSE